MYLILILLVAGVVTVWGQQEQIIDAEKSTLINYEMKKSTGIQWANGIMTTNQSKYDVAHYKIILDLDVDNKLIFGNVTTTALVLDTIDQLELNLRVNMIVDSIKLGSKRLFFSHKNDILTVNLDQTYSTGQSVIIRVDYHGSPSPSGFGPFAFDEYNGEPMIWSLSEPFGAHSWWPCKDIPSDKADSVDIFVKVPANLMAVSNGLLVSESIQGNKKTVHWFEKYPMSTYLVSVAVHPYSTFSDSLEIVSGTTMPIDYYVFQDKLNDAKAGYAKTKQMLQVFSELFGAYPFYDEKYGHAQFLGRANMEHQTISSLRVNASELVIAHELAHQWFGDLITCHNFGHIWLNEGFATYAEALWNESVYGIQAYRNRMEQNQYFEGGTIFVTQMDVSTIFNYNRSYRKASWVLHMLRHVVGDSTFFEILKSYTASSQFRFKTATTEQFQQFCEEKSGQDLSGFFHQWIHEEFYPRYVYDFMVKDSSGFFVTSVEILQEQTNTVIFEMPIDVQFRFVTGDTTIQIKNHLARQNYHFVFHRAPMQCILDPDNWILKNVSQKTHVDFLGEEIEPEAFVGLKSYPNPFSKQTKININLLESVTASVTIYNSLGQQVNTLYEGKFPRGDSSLFWSGQNKNGIYLTPGIYFCKFEHPGFSKTIKLLKQ